MSVLKDIMTSAKDYENLWHKQVHWINKRNQYTEDSHKFLKVNVLIAPAQPMTVDWP